MTREISSVLLDEPQLAAWGERIGRGVALPVFIALRGELGAGKSVLARGVARGAGVSGHMPSPTFNLVFHYDGDRAEVYHIDLYRLTQPEEVWELGWRELGGAGQIVLVEWPERAETLLPADRWDVTLDAVEDEPALRRVSARARGAAPAIPAPEVKRD